MVDLETLGTDSDAIILTIGAIPFSPDGTVLVDEDEYFYEKVHLPSYNIYKNKEFSVDWGTLLWWLKQDPEPLREAFLDQPRYPIWVVMKDFLNWLEIIGKMFGDRKINMWSHGKDFDVVLLQNAFKVCGLECPWKFWESRDTRTLYALTGVDTRNISMPEGFKAHNAIGDCLKQIEGMRLANNVLNNHIQGTISNTVSVGNQSDSDKFDSNQPDSDKFDSDQPDNNIVLISDKFDSDQPDSDTVSDQPDSDTVSDQPDSDIVLDSDTVLIDQPDIKRRRSERLANQDLDLSKSTIKKLRR